MPNHRGCNEGIRAGTSAQRRKVGKGQSNKSKHVHSPRPNCFGILAPILRAKAIALSGRIVIKLRNKSDIIRLHYPRLRAEYASDFCAERQGVFVVR